MNRSIILPAVVTAFVALSPAGVALADNPHDHGNIGQPDQEASDNVNEKPPGFSTGSGLDGAVGGAEGTGFANAEPNYAGSEDNPNMGNINKAISQYDVAGFQWCQHHSNCPPE